MTEHTQILLSRIETHCRDAGVAESTFGHRAVNDGKLVQRLRSGRSITLATYAAVTAALDAAESTKSEGTAA